MYKICMCFQKCRDSENKYLQTSCCQGHPITVLTNHSFLDGTGCFWLMVQFLLVINDLIFHLQFFSIVLTKEFQSIIFSMTQGIQENKLETTNNDSCVSAVAR